MKAYKILHVPEAKYIIYYNIFPNPISNKLGISYNLDLLPNKSYYNSRSDNIIECNEFYDALDNSALYTDRKIAELLINASDFSYDNKKVNKVEFEIVEFDIDENRIWTDF